MTGQPALKAWLQGLLSLAAGALTTLAFAPFSVAPLAPVGLALLFYLWRGNRPREALRNGWLFGLGLLGVGVFWLRISIDQFGNLGWASAVAITLAFILAMALYSGLAGWVAARLGGHRPVLDLLLLYPALWVLSEWLRGWVLTGFPWLLLGNSQLGFPLQGLAPLLGVYGVSWGVALSAGLLVLLLAGGIPRRYPLLALLGLWVVAWGAQQIDWTRPAGGPLRVSLVQGNIPQELKWKREQLQPTLDLYTRLTRAHWDSDLVIWPETAVPAFESRVRRAFLDPLQQEARSHGADILLGIALRDPEDGRYFNAMLKLGDQRESYAKRHLVPFGEFLPLDRWLRPLFRWMAIPMSNFSPASGTKPLVTLAGYPAGVSICYEDAFPEEVIDALPEAALLINASNDAWFGDSLAPHQHLEIARMRALESGRFMLRATNTGISAIIDPHGRVLGLAPAFNEAVLTRDILPMAGMTPYARTGNTPVLLLCLLAAGGAWWLSRRT